MNDRLFIREKDKQAIIKLCKTIVPSATVLAYGSRVNGRAHEGSDLDLALRADNGKSVLGLAKLRAELTDSNIPILVDVKDWATLPSSFQKEIAATGIPLY